MGERCEGRFFVDTCLLTSMKHITYDWYLLAPVTCQWCFLFAFAENTSSKLVQKPKAFSPVGAWFHRPQPWGNQWENQWETVGLTLTISILAARIFLWLRVSSSKKKILEFREVRNVFPSSAIPSCWRLFFDSRKSGSLDQLSFPSLRSLH